VLSGGRLCCRVNRIWGGARRRNAISIVCLALCLLAFALRVYRLDALSLWYDEGWSVHLARLAPRQALSQIMGPGHTHPPLYYLLLGMWQALAGPSEFSMRFPSLAFGTLTVALGYRLGRDLFRGPSSGWAVGVTSAFLLALAPSQLVYSQEARSYTLLALEYALLIRWTCHFLRRGGAIAPWGWASLILTEAAALYTHYFALVLLACLGLAIAVSLVGGRRWAALRRWLGAQLLVGWLYAPWSWTAIRQLGEHAPPDMQPLSLWPFLGLIWRFYFSGLSWAAAHYLSFGWAVFALAVLGGLSFLAGVALRRMTGWDWLALGCFLGPLAVVFAIEQVRPGLHPRYAFMLSVPLFLLLARQAALWLGAPGAQKAAGVMLGVVILASLALGFHAMVREHHKDDVRGLAAYLNDEATGQDLILFDYEDFAFQYYYHGQAPVLYLEGYGPAEPLIQRVLEEAQGRDRVFLVTWYTGHTDRREIFPFLLELNGRLEDDRPFRGLRLRRYTLRSWEQVPALALISADYGLLHLVGAFWERSLPSGDAVAVALCWRLVGSAGARYKAAVTLRDIRGRQIAGVDSPLINERGRPTEEWVSGTEVENYYVIPIPLGTPPLTYTLHVALYSEETLRGGGGPLDLRSETGAPSGKYFTLGEVALAPPALPQRDPYRTRGQLMLEPVGEEVAPGLVLEAVCIERSLAQPGTYVPVVLLWRATEASLPDYCPILRLVRVGQSGEGEVLAQQEGAPADGRYPTSRWRGRELLLDRRELALAPQAPAGEARLELYVEGGSSLTLGMVAIEETAGHLFELPYVQHLGYARFGDVAELVGYDLPHREVTFGEVRGPAVPLTLYWRAINSGPISTSYTVFTHLLTEDGARLVAQHDGLPQEGSRPTTSWVPREIIIDPHLLRWWKAYSGTCPIEVGLYDPATGQRLPAYDGEGRRLPDDRVLLDQSVKCVTDGAGP